MTYFIFAFLYVLTAFFSPAAAQTQARPLYELPPLPQGEQSLNIGTQDIITGNDNGLFRIIGNNTALPLWTDGKVKQIYRTELVTIAGDMTEQWYFITSKGILYSSDLKKFEFRNNGLPKLILHQFEDGKDSYIEQAEELKDINANPLNPLQLVTATKDNVYITYDGGLNWSSLGSMSKATAGIKAVALADMPHINRDGTVSGTDLAVFMSHPIFGFSYIMPGVKNAVWTDVSSGFKMMPSLTSPDEVSDILPVLRSDADGKHFVEIYLSQTFIPNIYRFDWNSKKAVLLYHGKEPSDTIDSLVRVENAILFTCPSSIGSFDFKEETSLGCPVKFSAWEERLSTLSSPANAAWIPQNLSGFEKGFVLNELWMLFPNTISSKYADKIRDKRSLYIPPYQVRSQLGIEGINKFLTIVKKNNLNSIVIDMKDDYGLLRYETKDPLVMEKASVSQYATNIDQFIDTFKRENIYLVARIVVFKDRNLSRYGGGKYAVWDAAAKKPWIGIKGYADVVDEESGLVTGKETQYYDENWVDPYSPDVWEYNTAIAKELISRGFNEIQFDYIRFPTDGLNLQNAQFRWKTDGMGKESALMSFLSYARQNIDAPLGIDIYGANGWYRTGARTGQDVEMLANYVDVICPMFYPSHFENEFLNYEPYAERPYRIYFYGTYRNSIIGRNKIIVRPWVQAFKLGVKYDQQYYNKDYVQQELFGIRDSANSGYMYWNNVGNYDIVQPDIGDAVYTGKAPESNPQFRKPAFGSAAGKKEIQTDKQPYSPLSVLDSVRDYRGKDKNFGKSFTWLFGEKGYLQ